MSRSTMKGKGIASPLVGEAGLPQLAFASWVASRVRGMRQRVDHRKRVFARQMRGDATDAEVRLWFLLRDGRLEGAKFRRQAPIGNAIVDFVCFERRLVVEVDGSQHMENTDDERRDAELRRRGFTVLRFWNNDVLADTDSVMDVIRRAASANP